MAHDLPPINPDAPGREEMAVRPDTPYVRVIDVIDRFSEITGKGAAWLILPMMAALVYEVIARAFFRAPTLWAYDVTYMLYGTLFMLGSAYTLRRGAHVRTDMLYRLWSPRTQGLVDAVCYVVFFFPGMFFFLIAGWDYAMYSFSIQERAATSAWGPPIWPFKMIVPITAVMMLIQGVAELMKSVWAAQKGEWL